MPATWRQFHFHPSTLITLFVYGSPRGHKTGVRWRAQVQNVHEIFKKNIHLDYFLIIRIDVKH